MESTYLHPGEYLRQVRETLSLSRDEIAARLNLDVRVIQHIEEGQFDKLPGKIFVTGYIRSYAKLLEVSVEDMLAQMGQEEKHTDLLPPNVNYGSRTVVKASRRFNLLWPLAAAVVILLAITVIIWMDVPEERTRTSVAKDDIQQTGEVPVTSRQQEELPPEQTASAAEQPLDNSGQVYTDTGVTSTSAPVPQSSPIINSNPARVVPRSAAELENISLQYSEDSWTEVTDADGNQLLYQLVSAGEVVKLSGKPPFRIFLGYAPGVRIVYQGNDFDHSQFIRGDLAQFVVGNR